jgi:hypothetical protein
MTQEMTRATIEEQRLSTLIKQEQRRERPLSEQILSEAIIYVSGAYPQSVLRLSELRVVESP